VLTSAEALLFETAATATATALTALVAAAAWLKIAFNRRAFGPRAAIVTAVAAGMTGGSVKGAFAPRKSSAGAFKFIERPAASLGAAAA